MTLIDKYFLLKHELDYSKINKSSRMNLIKELKNLSTVYLLNGTLKNKKTDYDRLVVGGYSSDNKFIILKDFPKIDNEEEKLIKIVINSEILAQIISYDKSSLLYQKRKLEQENMFLKTEIEKLKSQINNQLLGDINIYREKVRKEIEQELKMKTHNARGAGRKTIYTGKIISEVLEYLNRGNSIRNAAKKFAMSPTTVQRIKNDNINKLN